MRSHDVLTRRWWLGCFFLLVVVAKTRAQTIYIPLPDSSDKTTNNITINSLEGFPRHAYRVQAGTDIRVLTPSSGGLEKVSHQARQAKCLTAVNGGPFHTDGTSVGVLVIDGQVKQTNEHPEKLVGIGQKGSNGTTNNPLSFWILGAPPADLHDVSFFVTGFGWLVQDCVNVAPNDDNTGAVRAPRTAVGVDVAGNLVFVVADGCEKCVRHRGLTLNGFGQHLVDMELTYAINLDGGSSSVLVNAKAHVVNHPTCLDVVAYKCQRPVATVFCLGRSNHHDDDDESEETSSAE